MNTGTTQKVLAPSPLLAQITACGAQHRSGIVPSVVLKETRQTGLRGHSSPALRPAPPRAQVPVTPERSALCGGVGYRARRSRPPNDPGAHGRAAAVELDRDSVPTPRHAVPKTVSAPTSSARPGPQPSSTQVDAFDQPDVHNRDAGPQLVHPQVVLVSRRPSSSGGAVHLGSELFERHALVVAGAPLPLSPITSPAITRWRVLDRTREIQRFDSRASHVDRIIYRSARRIAPHELAL